MKKNIKRLSALLLMLCMLVSLMVPATFAEGEEITETPAVSDEVIVAETYPIRMKDMNHTDPATATGRDLYAVAKGVYSTRNMTVVSSSIEKEYTNNTLGWKYFASSHEAGLKYNSDYAYQLVQARGAEWNALQIKVNEDGRYALNITLDRTTYDNWTNTASNWAGDMTAYIIPLDVVAAAVDSAVIPEDNSLTAEQVAINSLMIDAYCVGTDEITDDESTLVFNKASMVAGEYVVVYSSSTKAVVCEMSLTETAADAKLYDFSTVATYQIRPVELDTLTAEEAYNKGNDYVKKFITVTEATDTTPATYAYTTTTTKISGMETDSFYEDGSLNWKYVGAKNSIPSFRVAVHNNLRIDADSTALFQIKVPTSGKYAFTLSKTSTGSTVTSPNVYVANVNDVAGDVDSVAVEANYIGNELATVDQDAIFDIKYYEAGEYYVAIENNNEGIGPISAMGLIQYGKDVIPEAADNTVTQTINFGLNGSIDPAFSVIDGETPASTQITLEDGTATTLRAYADASYAEGKLDWKIENFADDGCSDDYVFYRTDNLKLTTTAASEKDWYAVRFRVKETGYYSLSLSSANSAKNFVYMFPATAETMSAAEIEAQMTDANGLEFTPYGDNINVVDMSAGYMEGEYILVVHVPHTKDRPIVLVDLVLKSEEFTAEDVQHYNFDLKDTQNPYYDLVMNPYNAVTENVTTTDPETGTETTTEVTSYVKGEINQTAAWVTDFKYYPTAWDAEGNATEYSDLAHAMYAAYLADSDVNWRPDCIKMASSSNNFLTNLGRHRINLSADNTKNTHMLRLGAASDTVSRYGSFLLRVDAAGTYNLKVSVDKAADYLVKVHFVDTFITDARDDMMHTYQDVDAMIAGDKCLVGEGYTTLTKNTEVTLGQVTVDTAGDYLIVFEADNSIQDIAIDGITLEPVVEEGDARIGSEYYATFEAAVAAAEAGEVITMLESAIDVDVNLNAGVTLNLNGQVVLANELNAAAGQIIDTTDGGGLIRVDGDAVFAEDNAQLPLYDNAYNGYRLYNVSFESVTVTGKTSAPKFWFRVNFSNKAACGLEDIASDMTIQADLTWADMETAHVAVADSDFTASWASKYVANDSIYITVSALNVDVENFALAPQVAANGVLIGGTEMDLT